MINKEYYCGPDKGESVANVPGLQILRVCLWFRAGYVIPGAEIASGGGMAGVSHLQGVPAGATVRSLLPARVRCDARH